MASCCKVDDSPKTSDRIFTVALAGNPNSGKTTIFNGLTGLRQKVANYPGVTVEKKTGRCRLADGSIVNIVDLPGTYSLISRSPDEQVAMEVLRGLRSDTPAPDAVIVVVDASNLQRNLYLVSQLIEMGKPLVVALNMMDVAQRRGLNISPQRLEKQLGVPVIPIVGHKGQGVDKLKDAIQSAKVAPMPDWLLPAEMKEELTVVGGALGLLSEQNSLDHAKAIAERLLIGDRAKDLGDIWLREPVASLLDHANRRLTAAGIDPMQADIEAHYHWIDSVAAGSLVPACERLIDSPPTLDYERKPLTLSEKADAILVHKFWGLLIFALIMGTLFVTIFWLAQPIMDAMQNGIIWFGAWATHWLPDGPLKSLINDGVIGGAGTVISFVPQIALLFMFLAILEDSGYLARAAFLMDKLLARVGLHGKSFIPLLSSFACAIPGIMAARTIESRRDRLATIFIAPFMSCSARLPVYTLLIAALFAGHGIFFSAGIMLACYGLGILAAVGTAWIFKRSLLKGGPTTFILELPSYKFPQASQVLRQVWLNAGKFVTKAGTTILAFSVVLWALAYYPRLPIDRANSIQRSAMLDAEVHQLPVRPGRQVVQEIPPETAMRNEVNAAISASDPEMLAHDLGPDQLAAAHDQANNAVAAAQSEYSFAGRLGHWMEPGLRPLGFDWKMGIGLIGAFAARETFISTMGITYAVGDPGDAGTQSLQNAMRADHYANGHPVWTPLVGISLLVWFVLALQCMSTIAIVRRETGGWRWPIFMVVYMNVLAYVGSLLVFQVGHLIWHG